MLALVSGSIRFRDSDKQDWAIGNLVKDLENPVLGLCKDRLIDDTLRPEVKVALGVWFG